MEIVDIEKNIPHTVCEVICVSCKFRYISCAPSKTLLKDYQCGGCKEVGYVITTGQPLPEGQDES